MTKLHSQLVIFLTCSMHGRQWPMLEGRARSVSGCFHRVPTALARIRPCCWYHLQQEQPPAESHIAQNS